ncbi:translation initiation factor IF-2 [Eubacteriales bacterium KG127]
MTLKVHQLAKEMGITSKELTQKAQDIGIPVKNHMSSLSESDVERLKGDHQDIKVREERKENGSDSSVHKPKPPINRPIIDTAFLDARSKGKNENSNSVEAKEKGDTERSEHLELKSIGKDVSKLEPSGKKVDSSKSNQSNEKIVVSDSVSANKNDINLSKSDQHNHDNRPMRDNRPRRDDRPMRDDRPRRDDRPMRDDRPRRDDRPMRDDRPRRDDRPMRDDRPRRDDRPMRDERPRRDDRPIRDGGQRRDDRGRRDDRPRRDDKRDSRNYGYNKDKADMPRSEFRGRRLAKRTDGPTMDRLETKTNQSRHADKKKNQGKYKDKKDKFNKFEQNNDFVANLEKKTRKKKGKAKPQVIETEILEETLPEGTIRVDVPITVAGFCEQAEVSQATVIMSLMKLGIMANINQNIDEDTVLLIAEDLGLDVVIGEVESEAEEFGIEDFEDKEEDLHFRPPIITVMGHVDHGKTSLLDAIRKTDVTTTESGGITQHIGASEVSINGQKIVFLDTPGHEAFTAMRARGAHVTDIAVLVVAADDSVKPQTVESISHAKAAGVPIIVAINKMDKPAANPDRVKQDLTEHGILVEDWGGDIISVPVSAKSGEGITNLLEMILLQAEVLELKANPNRLASGSVIEARLDKSKGPVATLLVTNGTLKSGQSIVAGTSAGRIRLMTDYKGKSIKKAGPATAVEILGLTEVPQAGDEFNAVKEDKIARDIADKRKAKLREEVLARNSSTTLEKLFSQIQGGETKELNLIIKGDVQGSIGAIVSSLEKLNTDEVRVNIIHTGVGTVNESDVMLAGTSGAVIIGFNVRPSTAVTTLADRESIEIRTYRVIYDIIDDVENAMKGMLDPEFKEEVLGKVEIRNTFKVPGVGIIGGAYVTEGKIIRNAEVRLVRDGIVIHEGKISSLKRFKDDAKEVAQGYECGIGIEDYNDIKEGDLIECFHMVEIERK